MRVLLVLPVLPALALLVACQRPPRADLDPKATFRRLVEEPGPDLPDGDLAALLTRAAYAHHPELDRAVAEWEGARAAIWSAGARPNPSLSVGVQHTEGVPRPWAFSAGLGLPIETGGKRSHRIRIAEAQAKAAELRVAETAWRLRLDIHRQVLAWQAAREAAAIAQGESRLLAELLQVQDRRLSLGEVGRPERDATLLAARHAEDQARQAQAAEERAALDLAQVAGLAPASLLPRLGKEGPLVTVLGEGPVPPPSEALLNRLDIRQVLLGWEANEAALDLEVAKRIPNLRLGPGYTWDPAGSQWNFGLSLELPLLDRREGPIAEALARRKALEAELRLRETQALLGAEAAQKRAAQARLRWGAATQALQAAQTRETQTQRAFALGEDDRAARLGAAREVLALRRQALGAWLEAGQARLDLEAAFQRPLDPHEQPYSGRLQLGERSEPKRAARAIAGGAR